MEMKMKTAGRGCDFTNEVKPAMTMVGVQVAFAVVNVLYKIAANDGMSLKVIIAYGLIFAAAFMIPLALVFERNNRPKLTWTILFQGFLSGLFGDVVGPILYLKSLVLTSATFTSAMSNIVPAITFILSVSFRLEKLGIGTVVGKIKVLGTLVGIGGAMVLTFYKGVEINVWSTHINLLHHNHQLHDGQMSSSYGASFKHLLGSFLALASCFSYALWLIVQAKLNERYPCVYSNTALISVIGAIQATVYALCMEKDWNQWKLGWNIRLLTVSYSGIVTSGLMVAVISWCVRTKGPHFTSIFNPVMLVVVAFVSSLVLDEKLHLGSIFGSVLIVCGLYTVLWGKAKEEKQQQQKITQPVPPSEAVEI